MLSFEEFRAVENRGRSKRKQNASSSELKPSQPQVSFVDDKEPTDGKTNNDASSSQPSSIGDFLESYQMQLFFVAVVVADTFCAFSSLYLEILILKSGNMRGDVVLLDSWIQIRSDMISNLLQTISQFTMAFFTFEMVGTLVAFGISVLGHFGYLIDSITLFLQLYLQIKKYGLETRILNIFRLWRFFRLVYFFVNIEKDSHLQTFAKLAAVELSLKKQELETSQIKIDLKSEKEARTSIEDMLQNYKDEVDTLNEALKIAAMDIAEVAQTNDDDFLSDDDDLGEDEDGDYYDEEGEQNIDDDESDVDDDNKFSDAPISAFDKSKNKENLFRVAQTDMPRRAATTGTGSKRGVSSSSTSSINSSVRSGSQVTTVSSGVTFLINSDGSFQKK